MIKRKTTISNYRESKSMRKKQMTFLVFKHEEETKRKKHLQTWVLTVQIHPNFIYLKHLFTFYKPIMVKLTFM